MLSYEDVTGQPPSSFLKQSLEELEKVSVNDLREQGEHALGSAWNDWTMNSQTGEWYKSSWYNNQWNGGG